MEFHWQSLIITKFQLSYNCYTLAILVFSVRTSVLIMYPLSYTLVLLLYKRNISKLKNLFSTVNYIWVISHSSTINWNKWPVRLAS